MVLLNLHDATWMAKVIRLKQSWNISRHYPRIIHEKLRKILGWSVCWPGIVPVAPLTVLNCCDNHYAEVFRAQTQNPTFHWPLTITSSLIPSTSYDPHISCRSYTKGQSGRATIQGSQSNLTCTARERFGPATVSSVRKWYLEEHCLELIL